MPTPSNSLKVLGLQVENYKRVVAVELQPDGKSMVIGGRNAQGKSSLLDAIADAIGGKKQGAGTERPLRNGQKRGRVHVDLGLYRVTRKWTEKTDRLTIEDPEGRTYKSPQALLDKLMGDLSFDPLRFARLSAKEQAETLRQLTGLDTKQLDEERAKVYAERTTINAEHKRLLALAESVDVPEEPPEPGKLVSVGELLDLRQARKQKITSNDTVRQAAKDADEAVEEARQNTDEAETALAAAREALRVAEAEHIAAVEAQRAAVSVAAEAATKAEALIDPDLSEIDTQIAAADEENAAIRKAESLRAQWQTARQRRRDQLDGAAAVKQTADQLTDRLQEIDEERQERIAGAEMPVEKLGLEGDVVTFGGVPLQDASQSEKVRIGLAIAAALHPTLQVALIREGSFLDDETLAETLRFAEEHDLQVWIETVGNRQGVGVVIEDGQVV
jgi:DNA repair exonuclease SbcCD ATPase subunit